MRTGEDEGLGMGHRERAGDRERSGEESKWETWQAQSQSPGHVSGCQSFVSRIAHADLVMVW